MWLTPTFSGGLLQNDADTLDCTQAEVKQNILDEKRESDLLSENANFNVNPLLEGLSFL